MLCHVIPFIELTRHVIRRNLYDMDVDANPASEAGHVSEDDDLDRAYVCSRLCYNATIADTP